MADFRMDDKPKSEFEERVVSVDRVSYTVAGGRRLRFRALVVVGNRAGKVGMGVAKAGEVAAAIQKAVTAAKKSLITAPIINDTIPHSINVTYGSARILLKPAPAGTSVIAGGSVRAVIELAGIKNISSKVLGSNNKINNVAATLRALEKLRLTGSSRTQTPKKVASEVETVTAVEAVVAEPTPEAKTTPAKKTKAKAKNTSRGTDEVA